MKRAFLVMGSLSVLLLAGCGRHPSMAAKTPDNAGDSAQTYAVSQSSGYHADANGFAVNSLQAPSNQTYYFAFDKSDMRSRDRQALDAQANYLATHPNAHVRLEGNTDNRGSREYNVGLGWRRDQSVARILEQQGVRPDQIEMVSYGKQNPAVTGDGEQAWALNRRVNMIYK